MASKIVFLAKGHAVLGRTTRDRDGNIIRHEDPHFDFDDDGGCVAVGLIDSETMEIIEDPLPQVFGDFDPAGFLVETLKLLKPARKGNLPDFRAIVKHYLADHSERCCPFFEYCSSCRCQDCIVTTWMEED